MARWCSLACRRPEQLTFLLLHDPCLLQHLLFFSSLRRARARHAFLYTVSSARSRPAEERDRSCTKYRHIIFAQIYTRRELILSSPSTGALIVSERKKHREQSARRAEGRQRLQILRNAFSACANFFFHMFSLDTLFLLFRTSEKTYIATHVRKNRAKRYAERMDLVIGKERLASLFGNVSLRGRSPSGRRARSSRFSNPVIRSSMSSVPWAIISFAHTQA